MGRGFAATERRGKGIEKRLGLIVLELIPKFFEKILN